ncbi:MAG: SWIM zinc finger family protein [Nocardiopsaceae bacterium]|mgnify:CR=1 FL=1|nr:SWIM zinc finger family protein [Nocardiopsaceae bacterium]
MSGARGAGGELARNSRTWWSHRFIDALEAGTEAGRLRRGRGYAAQGAVRDLRVRAGEVTARVQGSRARPYRVSLILPVLDEEQWATVAAALAGQPLFRARLLAGELPPEVEQVFAVLGLRLLPRGLSDTVLTCSCPDWGAPCKHVAAALYVLADSLAEDPFLLLAWLGRDRGAFLSDLRRYARTGAAAADEAPQAPFADVPCPAVAAATEPDSPAGFWESPPLPGPPPAAQHPQPATFSADPPGDGPDLIDVLAPLYERLMDR